MWVTRTKNISHVGQETNAVIESYHGNMKAILKASRGKLLGRRVDWLMHMLTGDVVNCYDYMTFRKEHGFMSNKKVRVLVLTTIVRARGIRDECVELPSIDMGLRMFIPRNAHGCVTPCSTGE